MHDYINLTQVMIWILLLAVTIKVLWIKPANFSESVQRHLLFITNKLNKMDGQFDALKAKLEAQGVVLDSISAISGAINTSVDGIKGDVKSLKETIATLQAGAITEGQVNELNSLVDSVTQKINTVSSSLSAIKDTTAGLDEETPAAEQALGGDQQPVGDQLSVEEIPAKESDVEGSPST